MVSVCPQMTYGCQYCGWASRTTQKRNLVQEEVTRPVSESCQACTTQTFTPSPLPPSNGTRMPEATAHTPLLPQLLAEVALVTTYEPPHSHPNVPYASAGSQGGSIHPATNPAEQEHSRSTLAEGSQKLASELRTLCTALIAIPDKLASVCCACPAPLRPRNLLPQLFTSVIRTRAISNACKGTVEDERQVLQQMHVQVALAALVTSATLRGHADTVARWMHQQHAHAWVHADGLGDATSAGVGMQCIVEGIVNRQESSGTVLSEEHSPHACATCMCVSSALALVSEPSVHERLWHALLEASVQKLETRKPSSWTLVNTRVSTGVCAALWLGGTAHALPRVQLVSFWVKLLTVRGARLPPAALLHTVMVRFVSLRLLLLFCYHCYYCCYSVC